MKVQIEFEDLPQLNKIVALEQFITYFKYVAANDYRHAKVKHISLQYVLEPDTFVCRFRYAQTFEESWIKFLEAQANEKIDKLLESELE